MLFLFVICVGCACVLPVFIIVILCGSFFFLCGLSRLGCVGVRVVVGCGFVGEVDAHDATNVVCGEMILMLSICGLRACICGEAA